MNACQVKSFAHFISSALHLSGCLPARLLPGFVQKPVACVSVACFSCFFSLSLPSLGRQPAVLRASRGMFKPKSAGGLCVRYRCWKLARPRCISVGVKGNEESQYQMCLTAEERDDGSSRQRLFSGPTKPPPVAPPFETMAKQKSEETKASREVARLFVYLSQPTTATLKTS